MEIQNILMYVGDTEGEGLAGDDVSLCAERRVIAANTTRCQFILLSALEPANIQTICVTFDVVIFLNFTQ